MSSHKADLSVEETIALLKKTSLPTVIVEGQDDMIIYRRFEERLSHLGVSVLAVGGRLRVLELFDRRDEIPACVRLVFVADKDTWVNIGVPPPYQHPLLILTSGYSIENDVFVDGDLVSLLAGSERAKFLAELEQFIKWYALALSRHIRNRGRSIAEHPERILKLVDHEDFLALESGEVYPDSLYQELLAGYQRLLRGKSLMALLVRNTNYKGRLSRHSDKALLEMVAVRPGPLLQQVENQVETIFAT